MNSLPKDVLWLILRRVVFANNPYGYCFDCSFNFGMYPAVLNGELASVCKKWLEIIRSKTEILPGSKCLWRFIKGSVNQVYHDHGWFEVVSGPQDSSDAESSND